MKNIEIPSGNQRQNEEKKTPLQKVGAFLREGRQSRSISLEELSNNLRIGQEQLEALENGLEASLPEKVFIKAMIRRISDKLGLDTSFILQELEGREIKVKNIYEKKYPEEQQHDYKSFIPWMVISSGLLGLICSIPVINYFKTINTDTIQESGTSQKISYQDYLHS